MKGRDNAAAYAHYERMGDKQAKSFPLRQLSKCSQTIEGHGGAKAARGRGGDTGTKFHKSIHESCIKFSRGRFRLEREFYWLMPPLY